MSTLSIEPAQYRILKKIRRHEQLSINSFSAEQLSNCEYLYQQGFLSVVEESSSVSGNGVSQFYSETVAYKITPAGRAAIYSFKATFYKWWIPVVISIASFLVALFTLLREIIQCSQSMP